MVHYPQAGGRQLPRGGRGTKWVRVTQVLRARALNPALEFLEKYSTGLWSQGIFQRCRERALLSKKRSLLALNCAHPARGPGTVSQYLEPAVARSCPFRLASWALQKAGQPPESNPPPNPRTQSCHADDQLATSYSLTLSCK